MNNISLTDVGKIAGEFHFVNDLAPNLRVALHAEREHTPERVRAQEAQRVPMTFVRLEP